MIKSEIKKTIVLAIGASFFLWPLVFPRIHVAVQAQKEKIQLRHEVEVTLKLVQVYVTDRKGNPVLDLKKEDFVLLDNGKEQTITEFEKHVLSLPSLKEEQPEIAKETPLPAPREIMSRKFFLLFDFAYNNAKGVIKAREAALHFIDTQVQPSDEVGVLSYSAIKALTLHEYLTTDHKKVREVVEKIGINEILGRAEDLENEYWGEMSVLNPPGDVKAKSEVESSKFDTSGGFMARAGTRLNANLFSRNMGELAKALRYIPGHKNIILFSSGIPYALLYGSLIGSREDWGESLVRQKFEDMIKELSASNTTVFPMDTEEQGAGLRRDTNTMGIYTLHKLASETGGKYFGNINNYQEHIEKIQNLTGCYYVLGYYVDDSWDGKYHKTKVEVRRPGCKVYAQRGYFSSKPFAEYTDLEKTLHLIDLALSEKPFSQSPLRFPFKALSCSIDEEANLCLISKIDVEEIKKASKGKIEIVSLIFDAWRDSVEFRRAEMDLSKQTYKEAYYHSFFSLSPGFYEGRVIIRNLETGRAAVAASAVIIPERPERGIELFTPLFLSSEKGAFYLAGSAPKKKGDKDELLSLADYFHFNPDQCSPFLDDVLPGDFNIQAVVSYGIVDVPEPEVEISAYLVEKSSKQNTPLPLSVLGERKDKGRGMSFVNIQIPELPSGEYALKFVAEERTSQSSSQIMRNIKISHQDKGSFFSL